MGWRGRGANHRAGSGSSKDCDFLLGVKKPFEVSKQRVDMILHSF